MRKLFWVILCIIPVLTAAQSWVLPLEVSYGSAVKTIALGTNESATSGFDLAIDVNYPILPPSGLYAFFPINDPAFPYVTMLSQDFRETGLDEYLWKGTAGGVAGAITMRWNSATVPLGEAYIGIGTLSTAPSVWLDMTVTSTLTLAPDQYFWVSYTAPIDTTGDDDAPTLVSTYPADGATFVPTDATVEIILTDDRTGVDVSSIIVRVESIDVTAQCVIMRSGTNWIIHYTPATGFPPEDNITVSVRAADINTVPNVANYTFSFTTHAYAPISWEFPFIVHNIEFDDDTVAFSLSLGEATSASAAFDPDFDVPYPGAPAGVFYAFFPLEDDTYGFSMLTRDIRAIETTSTWIVRIANPASALFATWNPALIPDEFDLEIGTSSPISVPEEWFSMRDFAQMGIPAGQWIWLRKNTAPLPDVTPPTFVSSVPAIGEIGVATSTSITIAVADNESGINLAATRFFVNGADVTSSTLVYESDGVAYAVYTPTLPFADSERIDWRIEVSDNALAPNSAVFEGYFRTGFYPVPPFLANLTLTYHPESELPYIYEIAFGTDEAGTDGFDVGLDFLAAPPMPGSPAFYFPLDDPLWNSLTRDIRSSANDSIVWIAKFVNIDAALGTFDITWNPIELPDGGTFSYAVTASGETPTTWLNMRTSSNIEVTADGEMHIMFRNPTARYCISGTITLEGTTDYSGTTVEIIETGESFSTDATGAYSFCNLARGNYTLRASHNGYTTVVQIISVLGNTLFSTELMLQRFTITGDVSPNIAGLTIWLGEFSSITDETGHFEFTGILPGTYELHTTASGYVPYSTSINVTGDTYIEIVLVEILNNFAVRGNITLQGETNFSNINISLGSDSLTTDESGYFFFGELLEGEYAFHAHRTGFVDFDTIITVIDTVTINRQLTRIETRRGEILVRCSVDDGTSPSDIIVVLEETHDTLITLGMGRARFRNVLFGTYTIVAAKPGYYPETTSVVLDSTIRTVDITLRRQRASILGIVNLSDSPLNLSGSIVTSSFDASDTTEVDGSYNLLNAPLEIVTLTFSHAGYASKETTITITSPIPYTVNVTLMAGGGLNPPQNLTVIAGLHNRAALRWQAPALSDATLLGYAILRRHNLEPQETIATVPAWTTGYIDAAISTPFYWYQVIAIYAEGNSAAEGDMADYAWLGDDPASADVLLIDFDNGAVLSGANQENTAIEQMFARAQMVVQTTNQDQQLTAIADLELLNYQAVFIVTGVYDADNDMVSEASFDKIYDYLGAGGNLYWEGADVGFDYTDYFDGELLNFLGVDPADDGRPRMGGNVSTLTGVTPFFDPAQDFSYAYNSLADHYIDEFRTRSGSSVFLRSQTSPAPNVSNIRAVAKIGSEGTFTVRWRTIVSSVYTGAVPGSKMGYDIIRAAWFFFTGQQLPDAIFEEEAFKLPEKINMTLAPSPFNSTLSIAVDLPTSDDIHVEIRDIAGRCVAQIFNGALSAGQTHFVWSPNTDAASGVYFVSITGRTTVVCKSAVLIK